MRNTDITHSSGASHGSLKSYLIGFILSIVLTAIPFAIVMGKSVDHTTALYIVMISAVVQILVHLVCFLHMNTSSEERWNLMSLLFTILIILILVVGSLWIMYHLNTNMMSH